MSTGLITLTKREHTALLALVGVPDLPDGQSLIDAIKRRIEGALAADPKKDSLSFGLPSPLVCSAESDNPLVAGAERMAREASS